MKKVLGFFKPGKEKQRLADGEPAGNQGLVESAASSSAASPRPTFRQLPQLNFDELLPGDIIIVSGAITSPGRLAIKFHQSMKFFGSSANVDKDAVHCMIYIGAHPEHQHLQHCIIDASNSFNGVYIRPFEQAILTNSDKYYIFRYHDNEVISKAINRAKEIALQEITSYGSMLCLVAALPAAAQPSQEQADQNSKQICTSLIVNVFKYAASEIPAHDMYKPFHDMEAYPSPANLMKHLMTAAHDNHWQKFQLVVHKHQLETTHANQTDTGESSSLISSPINYNPTATSLGRSDSQSSHRSLHS